MPNQPQHKPAGPRLPAAKDAAKLMQEGALAMERGQWERAEKRLMAAFYQLRQLDPVSWPMFKAGHLVMELRLARGDSAAAASLARDQLRLVEELQGSEALEIEVVLQDLALILDSSKNPAKIIQALKRLRSLAGEPMGLDHDTA